MRSTLTTPAPHADVKRNGGDFSIFVWMKMSSEASLDANGKFLPHVGFFESVAPAQPFSSLYAKHGGEEDDALDLQIWSSCGDEPSKTVRPLGWRVGVCAAAHLSGLVRGGISSSWARVSDAEL